MLIFISNIEEKRKSLSFYLTKFYNFRH